MANVLPDFSALGTDNPGAFSEENDAREGVKPEDDNLPPDMGLLHAVTPRLTRVGPSPRSRQAQLRAHSGLRILTFSALAWLLMQNVAMILGLAQASVLAVSPDQLRNSMNSSSHSLSVQDWAIGVWLFATAGQLCAVGVCGGLGLMIHGYADLFLDKQAVFEQHVEQQMRIVESNIGFLQQAGGSAIMRDGNASNQSGTGNFAAQGSKVSDVTINIAANWSKPDVQDNARDLTKELVEKISALKAQVAPNPVVDNLAGDAETLKSEIAKPTPRQEWCSMSLKGVKEAAESLGEIATPVLAIVGKLLALFG